MMSLAEGYTPNDFKKLLVKKDFPLPTVCIINKKGQEPFCLSQEVYDDVAECYFSEWDNVVNEDEECYFISFPMGPVAAPVLISLAISLVISVAVYFLMPRPDLPQNQVDTDTSPTYDLSKIGNKIRLNLPMPVHYGTLQFYPDIASQPYTVSNNLNQRIYHVLLNCGFNHIEITKLKIDDTELSTVAWNTSNVRYPSDPATIIFPFPNILSKEVQNVLIKDESPNPDTFYVLNDPSPVSKVKTIHFDFVFDQGGYYTGGDSGGINVDTASDVPVNVSATPAVIGGYVMFGGATFLAMNEVSYFQNGKYTWNGLGIPATHSGPVNYYKAKFDVQNGTFVGKSFLQYVLSIPVATPIPFGASLLFVEYTVPNRINKVETTLQFNIQEIDSVGANVGTLIQKYKKFVISDREPTYVSFTYTDATAKRFKVNVRQGNSSYIDGIDEATQFSNQAKYLIEDTFFDKVTWIGLRGEYDTPEPVHNDLTLIELEIQASEKLNNSNSGIFNALGKTRLFVYDFGTSMWSVAPIQTNSPIWAWYDMATNKKYGAGLETSRISLSNLEDIYDSINGKGIECNVRFDTATSADEALQQIATAMRCKSYNRSGLKLLARDEEKASISAFFNMNNIIEGSISIEWRNKSINNPQWYKITYFDQVTNKKETVECVLAGTIINTDILPEELELRTITSREKAWQEGMYFCAQNAYRREQIKFSTTMEGFIPTLFDKVSVSHPVINSYQSGKVQKVIGAVVYLDEPVMFSGYATGFISFRKKDGTSYGPYICTHGVDQYSVNLIKFTTNTPDYTLFPFFSEADQPLFDPTNFTFGVNGSSTICIINGISPSQDNTCSIDVVTHDPRVHTVDIPVRDMPTLGSVYLDAPKPAYICDIQEYQNPSPVTGLGCTVNLATKLVTVTFNYSGYVAYTVKYLFNNLGVETLVPQPVVDNTAGIKIDTYTYVGNPPSRVTVTPTIRVTDSPLVDQVLDSLEVVVPIQII